MHNFVMFCKTYRKDFVRFKSLKESIDKFNADRIPLYISCPNEDVEIFQSILSGRDDYEVKLLPSEEIYQNTNNYDGYIEQQLVKMYFYKLNLARFYLVIDSDSQFIRPFYMSDFMYDKETPYIVMHEGKDAKLINEALGSAAIYQYEKKVKAFFGRSGKDYRFLTTPIIFSSAVLNRLAENHSFESLLENVPSEAIWHGEFLLYSDCIPFKQSEPFFKCMVYRSVYNLYSKILNITKENIAGIYMGIVMQSNMPNVEYQAETLPFFTNLIKNKLLKKR